MVAINNRQVKTGFTLIEMLVALVILSGTIVIASQAYSQFIGQGDKYFKKYRTDLEVYQQDSLIFERLKSSRLYMTYSSNLFGLREASPYWIGEEASLTGVTLYSLQDIDRSAVFKIQVLDGKLMYCESVIDDWLPLAGKVPSNICDFFIVFRTNVKKIKFRYFGWKDYSTLVDVRQRESLGMSSDGLEPIWFDRYMGMERKLMPNWVEMSLEFENETQKSWLFPTKYQDPILMYSSYQKEVEGN